jgi:acyl-homoserine-lactone acylase
MFTSLLGLPLFPWTPAVGFALGDVNEQNFRYLNHFAGVDRAQTVKQLDRIEQRVQGIPWVNTIAADRKGNAYYSMDGAIPNVPDTKATGCASPVGLALFPATGIPVLDGSNSGCGWDNDPDAAAPGIFGPDSIPRLTVPSYVHNGNDSHWVSNPDHPLEGYERIIGEEGSERSFRTRIGLIMAQERIAGTDGLEGKGFDLRNLSRVALGNRQYLGELWRDQLLPVCQGDAALVSAGACDALAQWDLRDNLKSNGAVLWRRFASNLTGNFQFLPNGTSSGYYVGGQAMWTTQFSASDPVNTPSGLNSSSPLVLQALQDAVADLEGAGIPLDAPMRGYQYDVRGGKQVPIHGGPGGLGVFNAISAQWNPDEGGYTNIPHGSSFIAAMGFKDRGCPAKALTFVTYGQTEDQASPHARDYPRAFSRKKWNPVPFCRGEVRKRTLSVERVSNR